MVPIVVLNTQLIKAVMKVTCIPFQELVRTEESSDGVNAAFMK